MLSVTNITKAFGGLTAVNKVSFEVNQGEIVAIIGPNGAGKTTIFNILTGVYTINTGEIVFEGKKIHNTSPQHIVKTGIARTFQNIRLFGNMRVIENVLMGEQTKIHYNFFDLVFRTPRFRKAEREAAQRAVDILCSLGFAGELSNYAKNLPYGKQRRLEIARAIATSAKLLILDEPAAGMNPQETESLMRFIHDLRNKEYTILLIEHDMNVVMNISDRVYVLDHGIKIAEGIPSEIGKNKLVIEAYLGKDVDSENANT
jgi:branched-chain amino acid transport system ATP-binding protein